MRVTVVGSINYDTIVTPHQGQRDSLGGVVYNAVVLSSLLTQPSKVYLVTEIGSEHREELHRLFESSEVVDVGGVKTNPLGTNENRLVYLSEHERTEKLIVKTGPFSYGDVSKYLQSDLILFNFITGSEIQLSLIEKTRNSSAAMIYLDVHSKVLGIRPDGTRYPQPWQDWKDWFRYADIVQMNIDECSVLLQEKLESLEALQSAAQRIAEAGPAQVLITLGSYGAFVYWRDDRESWKVIPASIGTHVVVDTTGCGDCFAAGYIWGLFRYDDPVRATCAANVVAGENCRFIGLIRDLDVNEIEVMASRLHSQVFHR